MTKKEKEISDEEIKQMIEKQKVQNDALRKILKELEKDNTKKDKTSKN